MQRLKRSVCLVDGLKDGPLGSGAAAQHDVLMERLLVHQHRHLPEALSAVVTSGVLVCRAGIGADDQSLMLDVLLRQLSGMDKVLHVRVDLAQQDL